MKRVVLCCLCAAGIAAACQSGKDRRYTREEVLAEDSDFFEPVELQLSGEEEAEPPMTMDELFDDFIFNYAGSNAMQRARTNFPLHLNAFGTDMAIEKNEWQYEPFFAESDFYTVFFNNEDDMELEKATDRTAVDLQLINAADSTIRTFHFDRQEGKWMLTREVLAALEESPMADFFFFYHEFANDSVLQRRSIARPLKFITSDPEDDFASMEGTLTPDQWFVFRPDMPQGTITNILYGQTYPNASRMVMLKRGISNGMLDIFTFNRRDGEWKLTCYEN